MIKITDIPFFNPADTLYCGQVFRFKPVPDGFLVISADKCAKVYKDFIISTDDEYFTNYFDLHNDYGKIYNFARSFNIDVLDKAAEYGKGIRILKQNTTEAFFSFIISQNNNIARIKKTIERLCENLGERLTFDGTEYYSFPSPAVFASKNTDFYEKMGLGYRSEYFLSAAKILADGFDLNALRNLGYAEAKQKLKEFKGIGEKVANCVLLFGLNKTEGFPVDTWIAKIYTEDFKGSETDREKMTAFFIDKFKDMGGYIQQYLFYYKRSLK